MRGTSSLGALMALVVIAALAARCGGGAAQRPPINTINLSKSLIFKIESEPSGASVFEIGPDGKPAERLGETPLEWIPLELGKEEWKFNPESSFLAEQESIEQDTLAQHIRVRRGETSWSITQGRELCIDLLFRKEGYRPARLIRCFKPKELPALWSQPSVLLRARLVPAVGATGGRP